MKPAEVPGMQRVRASETLTESPLTVVSASDESGREVSAQDVVEALIKGKWIIFTSFVLLLLGAAFYTRTVDPVYRTNSVLLIDRESNPQLTQLLGIKGDEGVMTDVELIKSRTIAGNVAQRLIASDARTRQFLTLPVDRPNAQQLVAEQVGAKMVVRPRAMGVNIVDVIITSTSPQEAALVANLFAEEYSRFSREGSRTQFRAAREFLEGQAERVDTTLRSVEGQIVGQAEGAGINPEAEATQLMGQLAQLKQRQDEMEIESSRLSQELSAYQSELARVAPRLATRIGSTDDAVIAQHKQNVAEVRSALEVFYSQNPELRSMPTESLPPEAREIVVLRRRLAELEADIDRRSSRIVDEAILADGTIVPGVQGGGAGSAEQLAPLQELSRQILTRRAQVGGVDASRGIMADRAAEIETRLRAIPGQSVELERLKRSLGANQETFLELTRRLNEAQIAEQSELGTVRIVDAAPVPRSPISPKILSNLLIGSVLGIVLGFLLVLLRNLLETRIRRPEDIRKLGATLLAIIPDMRKLLVQDFGNRSEISIDGHTFSTSLITILNPGSPVADNYRRLRTNLRFLDPDNPPRVLAVTSPGPGEGKSVTAMNLCVAIAQAGHRVVYVDADLRRPMGHRMLGLPREPGLSDLLFDGGAGADFEAFSTAVEDLYVIPSGARVANPSEVLSSRRMQEFVHELSEAFEFVIIDTAPVLVVTDALTLGTVVDGTIIVCSADETHKLTLERSIESMEAVGAKVAGVVLNRFNPQSAYGGYAYAYAYGYGYSNAYGYGYSGYGGEPAEEGEVAAQGNGTLPPTARP